MHFLNEVDIHPKHFISTGVKLFFTEKIVKMNDEDSAQKVHRQVHKKFIYYTDIYVCDRRATRNFSE